MDAVELGIQIVTPDQSGEAITEKILLEPRLFECPLSRRLDAAHALGVPGKLARLPSVDSEPVEKHRSARPTYEASHVERQLKIQVVEIRRASARATCHVREALGVVDESGTDATLREGLVS